MKIKAACAALLLAFPGIAQAADRQPARLSSQTWVVAALLAEDADRICFVRGPERLSCISETYVVSAAEFEFEGKRIRVLSPGGVTRAAVVKLTLTADAEIRAIACKTIDGAEVCSEPSSDLYALRIVPDPKPPKLIDLQAIENQLSQIEGAIRGIRTEIAGAE